jgi:hypothetical protein
LLEDLIEFVDKKPVVDNGALVAELFNPQLDLKALEADETFG